MESIFRVPWEQLTPEDVEAFLIDAVEEGLTWEAKGGDWPKPGSVRKSCCGFANSVGGYLIVGTGGNAAAGWTLPGIPFEKGEPTIWITSVVHDGLRPRPPIDVKAWSRGDERYACVVQVTPVSTPPCMTSDGIVYQRVSGQTVRVTDQSVLADLIRRGGEARSEAERRALRAALRLLRDPQIFSEADAVVSVSLAPVAGPEDKTAALFNDLFAQAQYEAHGGPLQVDSTLRYPVSPRTSQDRFLTRPGSDELGAAWTLASYWDGSVGAVFTDTGDDAPALTERIRQAWGVIASLVEQLGGYGEAHLVVLVNGDHHGLIRSRIPTETRIQRWTEVRAPTVHEVASVERELERMFGRFAPEPSSEPSEEEPNDEETE